MMGCDWTGVVDVQWDSRSEIMPPEGDFFKNNISLTWQSYIPILLLSPLEGRCDPSFQHFFESHLHKDTLCQVWLKLAKWLLRRRFLKVVMNVFFLYVAIISPWKKCMALNLNKFEFPLPKNTLCHVWLKFAQWFWRRFSKFVNIFSFFVIISP